jgi:hypothetical protein
MENSNQSNDAVLLITVGVFCVSAGAFIWSVVAHYLTIKG